MRTFVLVAWLALVVPIGFVHAGPAVAGRRNVVHHAIDPEAPSATAGVDGSRGGRSPHRAPQGPPERVRSIALGSPLAPPMATRDGTLYVPTEAGLVVLGSDGRERFRLPGEPVLETPTLLADGDVAFATTLSTLVVVSPEGAVRRRTTLTAPVVHSLLGLSDGALCYATRDLVFRCDEPDGSPRFVNRLVAVPATDPALAGNGTILLAVGDELLALDVLGTERFRARLGASVALGPVVAQGGRAFVLTFAGELVAVDLADGRTRRRLLPVRPGGAGGLFVGPDGGLVVAVPGAALLALDAGGEERFRTDRRGTFGPAGLVDADGVFLGVNQDGVLHALLPDGRERWRIELGERTDAAPLLLPDGTLVLAFRSGSLAFWRPPCASTSSTSNCPRN